MPVFGEGLNAAPFRGTLYREEPQGWLVQSGENTVYLPRDVGHNFGDVDVGSGVLWRNWQQNMRRPSALREAMRPIAVETRTLMRVTRQPPLLTIMFQGSIIIQGTEEQTIGIYDAGVVILREEREGSPYRGVVTIMDNGAVIL